MQFRPYKSLATLSILGLALTACSGAGAADEEEAGGESQEALDVAISFEPGSLDPGISAWGDYAGALAPGYSSLLNADPDGITAGLAESWEVLDHGATFEFTLREGLMFDEDTALDAEAVVNSLDYWGQAGGPYQSHFESVENIEALDERTVRVELEAPNEEFLWLFTPEYLAGYIISPQGLEDPESLGLLPQGAGPYTLNAAQTISGNVYVYEKNPHYYDAESVEWDTVNLRVYTESNSAAQALNTGEIDVMITDAITANSLSDTLNEDVDETTIRKFWSGIMIMDHNGTTDPALADVNVRRALNHAIDRDAISEALFGDYGGPITQVVTDGNTGYSSEHEDYYEYDPEKAQQLLADAGYGDGLVLSNALLQTPRNQQLSEAISGQLSEVGVTVDTSSFSNLADWRSQIYTQDYGITIEGHQFFQSPYLTYRSVLHKNAPFLGVHEFENDELNSLVDAANAAPEDETEQAWTDAFSYVVEEAWFVPVAESDSVYFYGPAVDNVPENLNGVSVLDMSPAESGS